MLQRCRYDPHLATLLFGAGLYAMTRNRSAGVPSCAAQRP